MMAEKEDLGLSLSLNFTEKRANKNTDSSSNFSFIGKTCWNLQIPSSVPEQNSETMLLFKGIDVNRIPPVVRTADREEEEGGTSSPNSTVSSISGKRSSEREEQEAERACSRSISDEEDAENTRKKLRLSKDQSVILEESFKDHSTLNPKQKMALAKRLGLRPRQVEVWFQNRRARTKLKQTEVDYEFLKKCCENLTEENRRLHKEVQQLRALKLSPQTYMQMSPPTTLTMCPSCERVAPPPPPYSAAKMAPATTAAHPCPIAFGPWSTAARVPQRPFIALQYPRPQLITPNF